MTDTHVPMPVKVNVLLTVRDGRDDVPVIVLNMVDVTGDVRTVHLTEDVGMELCGDLAVAVRQLHHGHRTMPY